MARPEKRMRRPEKQMRDHWIARAIHKAWKETGLGVPEVWLRYRVGGGDGGQSGVKSWLYGWTIPDVDQYLVIARALNTELKQQGKEEFTLPLLEEPPNPLKAQRVRAA